MLHEEMCFKVTETCIENCGWGNIYGIKFYTTQPLVSNFRCIELLSDPRRIRHNEVFLHYMLHRLKAR